MPSDINIRAFVGMNNLKAAGRFWADVKSGVVEPRIVLNADAGVSGDLQKRQGKSLFIDLPGAHSLWAGRTCMLCMADGVLYRIFSRQAVEVGRLSGPDVPVAYEEAEDRVYIANQYNTGIYNPVSNDLDPWGINVPDGPILLADDGGLPAGVYRVTMTALSGGEISGNGPVAEIELAEEGGIGILNRPANCLVWVTDANEPIFYLAGDVDVVTDIPTHEPLPSFMCSPPPPMTQLCYAFGRMWGADGDRLIYSEPFLLSLFKPTTNYFQMDAEITVIAKVPTGLFVGTRKSTQFLAGTVPDGMQQSDAGAPSIPGTLAYANNLPELGDVLGTPEKGYVDVPVWRTTEGIVAGNAAGRLFNLTKTKLQMGVPARGASLYRTMGGIFQYITTSPLSDGGDAATNKVFTTGRIHSSTAGFGDSVDAEIRKGGVTD
jgi:hypothetical protein